MLKRMSLLLNLGVSSNSDSLFSSIYLLLCLLYSNVHLLLFYIIKQHVNGANHFNSSSIYKIQIELIKIFLWPVYYGIFFGSLVIIELM